jgi:hypothetical protein
MAMTPDELEAKLVELSNVVQSIITRLDLDDAERTLYGMLPKPERRLFKRMSQRERWRFLDANASEREELLRERRRQELDDRELAAMAADEEAQDLMAVERWLHRELRRIGKRVDACRPRTEV